MAGIEKQGIPDHKFQFQGQEIQEEFGLNWSSFKWRNADVQIGRFHSVDPLAEDYYYNSPYAFSENKVVAHVELEGLEAAPAGKRNSAGVAYIYYVGPDGFEGWGLGGHTGAAYYGMHTYAPTTLYLPMSGQQGYKEDRPVGPREYHEGMGLYIEPTVKAVNEAQTIKYYLDIGEIVQRIHYELPDKDMIEYWGLVDGIMYNPGQAKGMCCTSQSRQLLIDSFKAAGYSQDEAQEAADKIIYYNMPEELSSDEVLETGSTRYDRFYKKGGKYYHSKYIYSNKKWNKTTNEIQADNFINYIETPEDE
ncbi:hypothetical protein [Chondrinema litorale]|uniref:hypothetical protein n=1 Tax=Chondrinema litorale TaxID=2994555 RepID=UPI002542F7E4|nr:hypothetical protein [Chondrinema litorale]UZR99108.1 hypothetical protein OQ292_35145 [Chondrinema litorale]